MDNPVLIDPSGNPIPSKEKPKSHLRKWLANNWIALTALVTSVLLPTTFFIIKNNENKPSYDIQLEYIRRLIPTHDSALIHKIASNSKRIGLATVSASNSNTHKSAILNSSHKMMETTDYRIFRLRITNNKPIAISFGDLSIPEIDIKYPGQGTNSIPTPFVFMIDERQNTASLSPVLYVKGSDTTEFTIAIGICSYPGEQTRSDLSRKSKKYVDDLRLNKEERRRHIKEHIVQHIRSNEGYIIDEVLEDEYHSRGRVNSMTMKLTDNNNEIISTKAKVFPRSEKDGTIFTSINI